MSAQPDEFSGWDDATSTSTSARGSLGSRQVLWVVLAAGSLHPSTSSSASSRLLENAVVMEADATSSGARALPEQPAPAEAEFREATRAGLAEFRRLTGLTWEHVARLFDVSRRSVHFWASGKPMTAEHEEHLHRMLAVARGANTSAGVLRASLLSVVNGEQVLSMLVERRYAEAAAVLGTSDARPSRPRTPLSSAASDARHPLPPEYLAAGEEEGTHPIEGRGRAVNVTRSKDRGRS